MHLLFSSIFDHLKAILMGAGKPSKERDGLVSVSMSVQPAGDSGMRDMETMTKKIWNATGKRQTTCPESVLIAA